MSFKLLLLLLGLMRISLASDSSISIDSEDPEADGQDFGGFKVSIPRAGAPEFILKSKKNEDVAVCIDFKATHEGNSYNNATEEMDEISNSHVDLDDDNEVEFTYAQIGGDSFVATGTYVGNASPPKFSSMIIEGVVTQADGVFGIKYSYNLTDYQWDVSADANAVYVLELRFEDCSDSRGGDSDEGDVDDDGVVGRRRLRGGEDQDSIDEGDGVSDDDSNEVDVGAASFVNTATATCNDVVPYTIDVDVVYDSHDVLLVFSNFDGCSEMFQDPFAAIHNNKLLKNGARSRFILYPMVVALLLVLVSVVSMLT